MGAGAAQKSAVDEVAVAVAASAFLVELLNLVLSGVLGVGRRSDSDRDEERHYDGGEGFQCWSHIHRDHDPSISVSGVMFRPETISHWSATHFIETRITG